MSQKLWKSCRAQRRGSAGFTLLELLAALAVLGIASTIFLRLFTSSNSLAASSLSHEVALNIAEEYLTEVQTRPENFVWPDYDETPPGEPQTIQPVENGAVEETFAQPPSTMPNLRRAYDRDRNLYSDFTWKIFAISPQDAAQYIELIVEVSWTDAGRLRRFTMSSMVPRNIGEGTGP